jgi:hypothetical protein
MAVAQIEQRVAALEAEVTLPKQKLEAVTKPATPWWQEIYGTFADDPLYEEAMRSGREYRESLRPKASKRATKQSTEQSPRRNK